MKARISILLENVKPRSYHRDIENLDCLPVVGSKMYIGQEPLDSLLTQVKEVHTYLTDDGRLVAWIELRLFPAGALHPECPEFDEAIPPEDAAQFFKENGWIY